MKACITSGKWAGAALQNGYSHHDDNMPHDKYADWQYNCLKEMYRLIKEDGAIFYNHKWRVQNGLMQDRSDIIKRPESFYLDMKKNLENILTKDFGIMNYQKTTGIMKLL